MGALRPPRPPREAHAAPAALRRARTRARRVRRRHVEDPRRQPAPASSRCLRMVALAARTATGFRGAQVRAGAPGSRVILPFLRATEKEDKRRAVVTRCWQWTKDKAALAVRDERREHRDRAESRHAAPRARRRRPFSSLPPGAQSSSVAGALDPPGRAPLTRDGGLREDSSYSAPRRAGQGRRGAKRARAERVVIASGSEGLGTKARGVAARRSPCVPAGLRRVQPPFARLPPPRRERSP